LLLRCRRVGMVDEQRSERCAFRRRGSNPLDGTLMKQFEQAQQHVEYVQKLQKENSEVRQIVQEWLDKQGHNRCWWFPELFKRLATTLDLKPTVEPELPPRPEFEQGCKQYQDEEFGTQ
jgi:hypothetical protein